MATCGLINQMLENQLDEKLDDDHLDLYTTVKYDNLFNSMAIVMLATAVDEFEQAVYTGSWGTAAQYREITKDEYDSLFEAIMKDYGIAGSLNSAYWRFVVIEAPCYYISYAMSALPSMGIYVKAQKDGFDAALDSYLKLFAFSDEESLCKVLETQDGDDIIDKEVTATYEEILNYCGLQGPFQEQLYLDLKDYLANEQVLINLKSIKQTLVTESLFFYWLVRVKKDDRYLGKTIILIDKNC